MQEREEEQKHSGVRSPKNTLKPALVKALKKIMKYDFNIKKHEQIEKIYGKKILSVKQQAYVTSMCPTATMWLVGYIEINHARKNKNIAGTLPQKHIKARTGKGA